MFRQYLRINRACNTCLISLYNFFPRLIKVLFLYVTINFDNSVWRIVRLRICRTVEQRIQGQTHLLPKRNYRALETQWLTIHGHYYEWRCTVTCKRHTIAWESHEFRATVIIRIESPIYGLKNSTIQEWMRKHFTCAYFILLGRQVKYNFRFSLKN